MIPNIKLLVFMTVSLSSNVVLSDLISLEDTELSHVDGAGIGIVLEDFVFEAGESVDGGNTFDIGGLKTSSGGDVVLSISQLYIAGADSNQGANVINNPVNIGRLTNPFNLELIDGNDVGVANKAVFEFAAPKTLNGSRLSERPDMGIRFDLEIDGNRAQSLETHVQNLSIDGSYLRLWGGNGRTEGEIALNINTPQIDFFACDAAGNNCGETVTFSGVDISAQLGSGDFQPVTFEVLSEGQFVFDVASLQGKCASVNASGGCSAGSSGFTELNEFYTSGPRADIRIDDVTVGGTSFGSSTITNLQIQYLEVRSRDL